MLKKKTGRELLEFFYVTKRQAGVECVVLSDWSCRVGNLLQPIRGTTRICVMTRHQYGISALVSQTSFGGKPVVAPHVVSLFCLCISQLKPPPPDPGT